MNDLHTPPIFCKTPIKFAVNFIRISSSAHIIRSLPKPSLSAFYDKVNHFALSLPPLLLEAQRRREILLHCFNANYYQQRIYLPDALFPFSVEPEVDFFRDGLVDFVFVSLARLIMRSSSMGVILELSSASNKVK